MTEVTILSVGLFVLLIISFYLSDYDFFSPSFIICLLFTFGSVLALYAIGSWGIPQNVFTIKATWLILSGTLVFIIFEQITKVMFKKKRGKKKTTIINQQAKIIKLSNIKYFVLLTIAIMGTLLYVFGIYSKVRLNGYNGGLDFQAIAAFNHRLSFQDDTEGGISRIARFLQQAAQIIMYISAYIFFNNVVCCKDKIRKNIKYFIPIVTWIPNVLVTSSRGSYLQVAGACVFFFYIMLCRRNRWQRMKRNYHKIIKYAAVFFAVVLFVFYAGVANGAIGRQTNKTLIDYITMYLGAPIIHFNQFLTNPPSDTLYFGQETFNKLLPVFERFGLVSNSVSGQLEMRNIIGIYSGNVYTFFRRPYHDFGLFGMYIIVALTAVIFSYVYYKKIYGKYQTYKNDRTLILYSYFMYIIYIFSIDCAVYLYVYFGIIYFLVIAFVLYEFCFGHKFRIGLRHRVKSSYMLNRIQSAQLGKK